MENLAPTPDFLVEQPVTNNRITGRVTQAMRYWLLSLADRVNACPQLLSTVAVTGKTAAISATSFDILSVAPGVYRLSMAARITRAASTSSSLTVTFGWTQAVSCTTSSVAMTGNTTATVGSLTILVRVDEGSTITYATSYASSGGTTMQYRIDVMCEQVV
tara:strand:+ start:3017 stop:3499 length:483 start_codon:yes stop_codon:yes gene_type:complete